MVGTLAWLLAGSAPNDAAGQENRLVSTSDWSYEYIRRLQRRGYLLELHPTALPYTHGEVVAALDQVRRRRLTSAERAWLGLLERRFKTVRTRGSRAAVGGWLEAGARAANNDRLDPLRYTEAGEPTLEAGDLRVFPNAALHLYLDKSHFVAELGVRHDIYYDVDPDGLDAVKRLNARNEHAYAGYNARYAGVYFGRFSNHWAPYGQPGLLVSDNSRSIDQLFLRLGGKRLALRSMLGELDSATSDGRFTGRASDAPGGAPINRYISAHRIDWRPSRHVAFSFMESVLYSGPGIAPSLKFASPVHVFLFLVDNRPKNEEHNGFAAGSLWAHWRGWTLDGQALLDDVDIVNRSEPASIALAGQLVRGGLTPWLDVGVSGALVTGLTYNTHQPEGIYTHLLRGIGTQFSDYVQTAIHADLYPHLVPSLALRPQIQIVWQGEADIREPFPLDPASREALLVGVPERTFRLSLALTYQPIPQFWLRVDYGANWIENEHHIRGRQRTLGVGALAFGGRISLDRAYRLSF